jgi:uncharacterized protein
VDITIDSDDRRLVATVVGPDQPGGAAVLFVHGLGSDRGTNVERARAVTDQHKATCLAVDLGGHGASTGRLSTLTPRQNLRDVVAAYDALVEQPGVDPGRIGVCSASYGAYLSVLLTAQRPVARLLLRAPALYTDDALDTPLGRRRPGSPETSQHFLAQLARYRPPVLVVESEHDEVVGHGVIETYLATRPGLGHVVLPEAGHALTDPTWRAAFRGLVLDFFRTL